MRNRKPFGISSVTALAVALAVMGGVWRVQAQGNSASTVLRTFVAHEITAASAPVDGDGGVSPVLSANGNRAAFCVLEYSPSRVAHIFLINADGTGQQEVDTYAFGGGGVNALDVTADGSKVISMHDGDSELRIAGADGRGGRPLVTLKPDLGRIAAIRLSSDGSLVFFLLSGGNDPVLADETPLERGLYVINADGGSPPRRIVGIPEIARVLGLPENQFSGPDFGGSAQYTLDVSSTSPPRLAFVTHIPPVGAGGTGQGIFAVNLDGSNLASLTGRQNYASVAISGDGTRVGYAITTADGTADVVGVVGASGGTTRELARKPAAQSGPFPTNGVDNTPGFPAVLHDRLQLSYDGAWCLLGSTGVLVNAPTGYTLQLGERGSGSTFEPGIINNGLYRATMNYSATRFLYLA